MRIVHLHLPKTAGTALRHAFQGLTTPKLRICPARFENQFKNVNFDDFDFFSGHISFMLAEKIGGDYITVLRDPVDRFLSVYYFWRELHEKGVERSRNTFLATNYDLSDFVSFLDEPFLIEEFYNRMTWQIAFSSVMGMRYLLRQEKKLTDVEVLEMAKENLSKFRFIGFQERYSSLIDKLNSAYEISIPNARINITKKRERPNNLSASLLSQINRWIYLDQELYKYALLKYY
jgi:hypothetical protein